MFEVWISYIRFCNFFFVYLEDRQTDRGPTDRQTEDQQTNKQVDRQTGRPTDRKTDRELGQHRYDSSKFGIYKLPTTS